MPLLDVILVYFRSRQQELEAEHKAVEQQLRELVDKPGTQYSKCLKISISKVSDKMAYANSVNPEQTASDQGLHCLPFH